MDNKLKLVNSNSDLQDRVSMSYKTPLLTNLFKRLKDSHFVEVEEIQAAFDYLDSEFDDNANKTYENMHKLSSANPSEKKYILECIENGLQHTKSAYTTAMELRDAYQRPHFKKCLANQATTLWKLTAMYGTTKNN